MGDSIGLTKDGGVTQGALHMGHLPHVEAGREGPLVLVHCLHPPLAVRQHPPHLSHLLNGPHCRTSHDRFQRSILRKLWYIFLVVLQQAAQIMLCIKLENIGNLSLFYVMVPVWIILSASTVDVF